MLTFILILTWFMVVVSIYIWMSLTSNFKNFKKRGIPGRSPIPIFGTCWKCWIKNYHDVQIEDYQKYGNIFGTFQGTTPYLYVADPELIQFIFRDQFPYFDSHARRTINTADEYTNKNLASLTGHEWRLMRDIVNSCLTPSVIKQNMELINEIADKLTSRWRLHSETHAPQIDIQIESQCWLLELIAQLLFSMDDIDIIGEPNHPFVLNANAETETPKETMMSILFFLYPQYSSLRFNSKSSGNNYFVPIIRGLLKARNQTRVKPERKDMINILRQHLEKKSDEKTEDELEKLITAQVAGGLTSAHDIGSALSRILHCLALTPDAQNKARDEVLAGLQKYVGSRNEVICFDMIRKMPYLEQCINETNRLYPTFSKMSRVCNKDITHGAHSIPAGTTILVPSYAMDHDPKYYPEPYKFDPERFSPEGGKDRHPMRFLPFGSGPRDCPARFIVPLILKICLCHVLKSFKFTPVNFTVDPLPCKSSLNGSVAVMQEMWLGIESIGQENPLNSHHIKSSSNLKYSDAESTNFRKCNGRLL